MSASRPAVPVALLGVALAAAAALLLSLASDLTFFQDTWAFLMHRQGSSLDTLLVPHNEHIVVIPVALQKLGLEIFGMSSAMPEYVLLTVLLLVTAVLLFVYVRRRLGDWPALFAAVLVLFLGPAWQVLLWPFEIALVGSTMAGIAALLALEREDRTGDAAACGLLVVAVGFSSLGLAFAVGACVDVLQHRRERGLARAFVPAVALGLYGLWYLGYGHEAETTVTAHNVLHSPVFVVQGLSASVGALTGLSVLSGDPGGKPYLGFAALVVLVAALAWRLRRPPGLASRFWPVAATAATFWFLSAFAGREAVANRYMHFGAILILMMVADLLVGARFRVRALVTAGAIVAIATAINLTELEDGADWLGEQSVLTRADIGAMEIAERTVAPTFYMDPAWAGTPSLIDVSALEYFPAEHEFGSPAYTPHELAAAPEVGREHADLVLAAALPIAVSVDAGKDPGSGRCVEVGGGGVRLSPGSTRVVISPGAEATLSLRRFATGEFPIELAAVPGGSTASLRIPRDGSTRSWVLRVESGQPAHVCR